METGESAIPFSIPLQPTLKTYRSQSYSVGQMDPEFLLQRDGEWDGGFTGDGTGDWAQHFV
jgi:hypothetical protein